jgi:hypothetical protein
MRLRSVLAQQGVPRPFFSQPVLRDFSERLRQQQWAVRLALRRQPPLLKSSALCRRGSLW